MFLSRLIKPNILLTLICIFFLLTRIYKISEIPSAVYWDEASIGYNAYSIALTGKDEWGEFLPIHFRAFGEFKLPVYIYSAAVFVKLFGLNELSVRIPSLLFSLGSVIIIYFLAKKLTGIATIGILSSFFMTISPWYFIFSRTGYEATAGLMFYLLAIFFLFSEGKQSYGLLGIKQRGYLVLSTLSFILSAYSYNSFRIIIPLTVLIFILINFRNSLAVIKKAKVALIISAILVVFSVLPILRLYLYDTGLSRYQLVSSNWPSFLRNYLSHFSLNFLIFGDKNLRSQQAGFGQIFLPELILLSLGLIYIRQACCFAIGKNPKYYSLVPVSLLVSFIPAAITKESPHALRSISAIPFLSILFSMGTVYLRRFLGIRFVEIGLVTVMLLFFVNYFINFINIYPTASSKDWQYGYKRIFLDYKDQFVNYRKIIISDQYAQPYIFALFYLKYNPAKFHDEVVRNDVSDWGFSTVTKFDKFEFGKADELPGVGESAGSLIFASEEDKISGLEPVSKVVFLDGSSAFWVYTR